MSDHLAIMERTGRILEQVISGEKTIESRWTIHKKAPYQGIHSGDTVYFKKSGSNAITPVTAKATVAKALFYEVDGRTIREIIRTYNKRLCMTVESDFNEIRDKRHCSLIFLKDAESLKKPFLIDKTGHGGMGSAWITVQDIGILRRK